MNTKTSCARVLAKQVDHHILLIRGQKVMLDSDLAELYGVTTKRLNEQVKRNRDRFPADFMFRLTAKEYQSLRSQIVALNLESQFAISKEDIALRSQIATSNLRSQSVISKKSKGGRRYLPSVFTEQGVAMLSTVLNSNRAIQVNIAIMRAFVKLREMLSQHKELARKLTELERKLEGHDVQIHSLFEAIRQLMAPPKRSRRRIGFQAR